MIPALSLDASDETDSPAPEFCRSEAQQPDRLIPDTLSDMTDSAVRKLEQLCYAQFQIATTNADKADWIHNLAACMVELHKRGLSIGAKA
jgi:hypothetical protein